MEENRTFFTSESVSEGHPDKVCDQVSDSVLDALLKDDPNSRVACECYATTGLIVIGGEITTRTYVNLPQIAREVVRDIGYDRTDLRFDADSIGVINVIKQQSPDIALGVDTGGAGDQGMMFGYAINETDSYMPAALEYAHKIVHRLAEIRKTTNLMPYLRPDSKSQITVEYNADKKIIRIDAIVISTQHNPDVELSKIKEDCINHVIKHVLPAELIDDKTKILINPTGRFVIGGPHGDTGLTGRKIIVDTYGGKCPHGGGAFSGKDPTKVDRSAAYAARHIAKNIVGADLAKRVEIQISYAIGVAEPVSIFIDTFGTGIVPDIKIIEIIKKFWDLRPAAIIDRYGLRKPMYRQLAAYGHMGREDLDISFEKLDMIEILQNNI